MFNWLLQLDRHVPVRYSVWLLRAVGMLLANLLPFAQPGELLRSEMTQQVFRTYWPMAQTSSFAVAAPLR